MSRPPAHQLASDGRPASWLYPRKLGVFAVDLHCISNRRLASVLWRMRVQLASRGASFKPTCSLSSVASRRTKCRAFSSMTILGRSCCAFWTNCLLPSLSYTCARCGRCWRTGRLPRSVQHSRAAQRARIRIRRVDRRRHRTRIATGGRDGRERISGIHRGIRHQSSFRHRS